jgi:hypothetical protein
MPYTPVATDYTQPTDAVDASSMAYEFRVLKGYLQTLIMGGTSFNNGTLTNITVIGAALSGLITNAGTFSNTSTLLNSGSIVNSGTFSGGLIINLGTPLAVKDGGLGIGSIVASGILLGNGTLAPTVLTPGTLGQVLTMQTSGTVVVPAYVTPSIGQINSQIFVASGTFTPSAGVTKCIIAVVGGAGGSSTTSTGGCAPEWAKGGAGGIAIGLYTVVPGTAYTVTVGAGGAAASTGATGGTSSVGSFCSATGGAGGGSYGADGANGTGVGGTFRNGASTYNPFPPLTGIPVSTSSTTSAVAWSISSAAAPGAPADRTTVGGGMGGAVYITWVG